MLENLLNKTRTRRGVLKKLRDMGLKFTAPTKKTTAAALNKNLWRSEEDEELRSLFDQYRLENDCLQRIVNEFEDRKSKQQIIKRMLQLSMIADKSEILPAKQSKRRSKKNKREDVLDYENYSEMSTGAPKMKNKTKPVIRNVARTPLDVGTVRSLIAQIDCEQYQDALDWLRGCLEDAMEDTEEALEDDDGVPLVPLLQVQKDAMEDAAFKKLLIALGMQPPIAGIENYWRIPTYLNVADIKMRATIVAGEELDINLDNICTEQANEESDASENGNRSEVESTESEEDYLEKVQRQKINLLMFTKSDDEDEMRAPLASKIKEALIKNLDVIDEAESEDETATVKYIAKKLHKRRQNSDFSSSEDENEQKQKKVNRAFDKLKEQRSTSTENKPRNENTASAANDSEHEEIIEIEKKLNRKRRQPNAISSDEQEELDELYDKLKMKSEKSIKNAEKPKAKMVLDLQDFALNAENDEKTLLGIQENDFQLRITDDDDDDEAVFKKNIHKDKGDIIKMVNKKPYAANLIDSDGEADTKIDADDTTSNQAVNNVEVNNKRQRSPSASVNAASHSDLTSENNDVDVNDGIGISKRRSNGKRRRLAIIEDDQDEDY